MVIEMKSMCEIIYNKPIKWDKEGVYATVMINWHMERIAREVWASKETEKKN